MITQDKDETQNINIVKLQKDIEYIKEKLKDMCNKQDDYVTKEAFEPVKKVYNQISSLSIGLLVAIGASIIAVYKLFVEK